MKTASFFATIISSAAAFAPATTNSFTRNMSANSVPLANGAMSFNRVCREVCFVYLFFNSMSGMNLLLLSTLHVGINSTYFSWDINILDLSKKVEVLVAYLHNSHDDISSNKYYMHLPFFLINNKHVQQLNSGDARYVRNLSIIWCFQYIIMLI